ncbi:Protein pleiotropic regulatory locus 1 [Camellia lanceoleosa]|uniref:Protein pleiotropic regulatory locus 1 n=1 Tax=Camellia lanceoleosa TaxID=1840588 RepID=A0ACC0H2Y0_9ERIC|nr:Protein pleiotropic regulatory locus 1 [Camellia lanceoleosa]
MFRGRLLFASGYISVLVYVLFCVNCCNSSSCGDIHNISFPFRLKSDPVDNCGYKYVELECENNRTVLYLFFGKYYVQAINYYGTRDRFGTISLVDVGIQRNNCSSLPLPLPVPFHSFNPINFTNTVDLYYSEYLESFVALVSCEKPVKSRLYIDTTSNISTAFCENKGGGGGGGGGGGSSSSKKHSYVLVGNHSLERPYSLDWSDVGNLCSVDTLFPTRLPDGRLSNMTSLLEVHNALANGFDLEWYVNNYEYCRLQAHCSSNHTQNYTAAVCHGLRGFSAFLDGLKYKLKDLSVNNVLCDNGSLWFWDWKSGHYFPQSQTIVQLGSLDSEAGIYALSYDVIGSRSVTCEVDKTIKMWKEDENATPETHPLHFKPPKDIRRF